jgi:hypothetical protein
MGSRKKTGMRVYRIPEGHLRPLAGFAAGINPLLAQLHTHHSLARINSLHTIATCLAK